MADLNHSAKNQERPGDGAENSNQFSRMPVDKKQKIAAGFLVIFAVFVLILWYAQFKQGLTRSLTPPAGQSVSGLQVCQGPDCEKGEEERLRGEDTDKDGLSDWDELNTHQTSPYLEDSDSDGFSDKEEIDSGNDPNCPTGRDCYASTPLSPSAPDESEIDENMMDQLQSEELAGLAGALEGLDPAGLRQMLIDAGMDKNVLNQISDEELMKNFEEVLAGN